MGKRIEYQMPSELDNQQAGGRRYQDEYIHDRYIWLFEALTDLSEYCSFEGMLGAHVVLEWARVKVYTEIKYLSESSKQKSWTPRISNELDINLILSDLEILLKDHVTK
ncbi:MAG: hypothetical protein AAGE59_39120 [Cyanobacteria bacterium P01_F01_bin.86]